MANYRIISTPEYPNGQVVQFTEAEEAQRVADIAAAKIRQDAIDAAAATTFSAKSSIWVEIVVATSFIIPTTPPIILLAYRFHIIYYFIYTCIRVTSL